jgi:hypothetical protein
MFVLQPAEEAPKFRAKYGFVGKARKERLHRIDEDSFGPHAIDGEGEADEQRLQVVIAGLLDQAPVQVDVIDGEQLARYEVFHIKPQRRDVGGQFAYSLFERQTHTGFAKFGGPAHQEFHTEQRFAAARSTANQCRAASRQTTAGDLVESPDSRQCFTKLLW